MRISELSLNSNLFDLSNLLGAGSCTQDLLQQINRRAGNGSFFGSAEDPFRTGFQTFMQQVVEPIRQAGLILQKTADQLFMKDEYREITSIQELERGIPPCMQYGIVTYQPVRAMLNEDRIDGFGIDPNSLPAEDPFKRICESGKVTIHSSTVKEDGSYEVNYDWCSADPELTPEQAMALDLTREYIDVFFQGEDTRHLDFTDYPSLHG